MVPQVNIQLVTGQQLLTEISVVALVYLQRCGKRGEAKDDQYDDRHPYYAEIAAVPGIRFAQLRHLILIGFIRW